MGVSGSGKTTIGKGLADLLGLSFYDGDAFHPPENIDKMKSGHPLNDDDRREWLSRIREFVNIQLEQESLIIACSALKESYRQYLSDPIKGQCTWVYLQGDYKLILDRLQTRSAHFMPASLLQSQFEILETPTNAIRIDIRKPVPEILDSLKLQITL